MFASKAGQGVKPTALPDMKPYENKKVLVRMEGNRRVIGVLGGFDHFMNLTLRKAEEDLSEQGGKNVKLNTCVIRGSAVLNIEAVE